MAFFYLCLPAFLSYFQRNHFILGPIAILINRRAGKGKGREIANQLTTILKLRGIRCELFDAHWPLQYTGFSAVWLIGGDGTLNYFINHAPAPFPPLALFKGGTGNDFANLLYGEASLEEVVSKILVSTPRAVDMGICNGKRFINMAGIGFDGEVLKSMQTIRWLGGFLGYYYAITKNIFLFREPEYEIRVDGRPVIRKKLLLVQVANSSTTGGGFKVSPRASINDGKLDLMLCDPLGIFKRFLKLPLIRKGEHMEQPFVRHETVKRVVVKTYKPVPAQLDGELIVADQFEFGLIQGYLAFLY
jgi:YegS/Rv2252/BmrU family lipid kinase